jgi:hypothetical protein
MSPFSKRPESSATPLPAPSPTRLLHLFQISGHLRDPRYVWISPERLPSLGAEITMWACPATQRSESADDAAVAARREYILNQPVLVVGLPTLRGKTLVYNHSADVSWGKALAELANTPDADLRAHLPADTPLADEPVAADQQVRKAGGTPRFAPSGIVHGADSSSVQKTWCGKDNLKLSDVEWTTSSQPRLCQACEKHITGDMQPHVAIIYAWHESIPDEIRPPGKPNVERNTKVAAAMANDRITPDLVRAFMAERYESYTIWARDNGRPALMPLEHVKTYIKDWRANQHPNEKDHDNGHRNDTRGAAEPDLAEISRRANERAMEAADRARRQARRANPSR